MLTIFAIVFCVVVMIMSIYRMRSGGPGPATNWVPRSMRAGTNSFYARHGWREPFDSFGNRNSGRSGFK